MKALREFLVVWRSMVVRDREIIDAVVHPDHVGPSPALKAALDDWRGAHYWAEGDGVGRLVLIRSMAPPQRERWWLHILLLLLSFLTVWMGGALVSGASVPWSGGLFGLPIAGQALVQWAGQLRGGVGLDFAVALIGILLAHEMGHYIVARRYHINASPPYFVPAPPFLNFIGTFGAFIRLRSPVVDRRQLMDVGAAGPWAGFVVALVALIIGLQQSEVLAGVATTRQVVAVGDIEFYLGDSIVTAGLRRWLVGDVTLLLHPVALAGWFGMLVTMLNLLPLGQLDGGHVLYALIRDRQRFVGIVMWLVLLVLGSEISTYLLGEKFWGWWLWAGFTLVLGGGRLAHPSVLDRFRPLPRSRRPLGWATIGLFVVTFTPIPFSL